MSVETKPRRVPKPWHEPTIRELLEPLEEKGCSTLEIAQWFAIWGYSDGQQVAYLNTLLKTSGL